MHFSSKRIRSTASCPSQESHQELGYLKPLKIDYYRFIFKTVSILVRLFHLVIRFKKHRDFPVLYGFNLVEPRGIESPTLLLPAQAHHSTIVR